MLTMRPPGHRRILREGLWAGGGLVAQAAALLVGTRLITEWVAPATYGSFALLLGLLTLAESLFCKPVLQAHPNELLRLPWPDGAVDVDRAEDIPLPRPNCD